MKYTIYTLIISFLAAPLWGQIEVGLNTLPEVGDVLHYVHFTPMNDTTSYRTTGGDLSWDYGTIVVDSTSTESYLDITGTPLADSFPMANMILEQFGAQAAARRTTTKIEVLGFLGGPLGFLGNGTVRFSDPLLFRQVPINYGDTFSDEVEFDFVLDASIIPGLDSIMLPIPGASVDSLRIGFVLGQDAEANGWGELTVMGQTFEVLKVTQTNRVDNILELGINVAGTILWIDATPFFGNAFGGSQVSSNYLFLSADRKEAVLEISEERVPIDTMGNTELLVTGRAGAFLLIATENPTISAAITMSPNPVNDVISIRLEEDAQIERVMIFDINGRPVMTLSQGFNRIDVSSLNSGRYIVAVETNEGIGRSSIVVSR